MANELFLIEFEHDSRHLGLHGFDTVQVHANNFEEACEKIKNHTYPLKNNATGYQWNEPYENARNFRDKTIRM